MKTPAKIALYGISILFLAGIAAAIYLYTKPQKDLQNTRATHFVTAEELQKEFSSDEKDASEKYLNKVIEVTGTLTNADISEGKAISIVLATQNDMSSVICNFRKPENPEKLRKDEKITIRGELSGFLMDVLLNNCIIVDNIRQE